MRANEFITEIIKLSGGHPNTAAFMKDVEKITQPNPINDQDRLLGDVKLQISPYWGGIMIKSITSNRQGKGQASAALKKLTTLADKYSIPLALNVSALGGGKMNDDALASWYQRNGFEWEHHPGPGSLMKRKPKQILKLFGFRSIH